jgi:hypothetical protein
MWGKFEKFALRPLFSSVVAGVRAHEQLLKFSINQSNTTCCVTTHPVIARRRFVPTKQSPRCEFGDCFAKTARNDMVAEQLPCCIRLRLLIWQ